MTKFVQRPSVDGEVANSDKLVFNPQGVDSTRDPRPAESFLIRPAELVQEWRQSSSSERPLLDDFLEEKLLSIRDKISLLKEHPQTLNTVLEIVTLEGSQIELLLKATDLDTHEGRFIQIIDIQKERIASALELLHKQIEANPLADRAQIARITDALGFELRDWLETIPLQPPHFRLSSRPTLRSQILEYGEIVSEPLSPYYDPLKTSQTGPSLPALRKGIFHFPSVPETLIDASIESIRIFFELDAQFPNEYEQNQLKNICLSVADGMFRQTDSYFAKLIKELNERQPCKDDLTHLYQHTCLCLERGQRFIRRINGGINPRVPSEDTEYQSSLKTLESRLSGIWGELVHTFDTCLVPQSLYDLMGMYNELLNPNSRRGKYYREDPRLELALRSFKIEF